MNNSNTPTGANGKAEIGKEELNVKEVSEESLAKKWEEAGYGNPVIECIAVEFSPEAERNIGGDEKEGPLPMAGILQYANPKSLEVVRVNEFRGAAKVGDRNKLKDPSKYDKARKKANKDSKKRAQEASKKIEDEKKLASTDKSDRDNR